MLNSICADETDLPNWGTIGDQANEPDEITDTTAADFVALSRGKCVLADNWDFQWGIDGEAIKQDGRHVGPAPLGTGWHDFATSTHNGDPAEVTISGDINATKLWARENLQTGYIPFANTPGDVQDNISAEIYCHSDILNYDNYDRINMVEPGATYYCVAFNTLVDTCDYSIGGYKYDGNTQLGLNGWEIELRDDAGALKATTTTMPDVLQNTGYYHFDGLCAGTYNVHEVMQANWTQAHPVGPDYYTITFPGASAQEYNFVNTRNISSIIGCKWNDINNDGNWASSTETEIMPGWEITIEGEGIATSTVTDEWGCYEFSGLFSGSYVLSEIQQAGWVQTYPLLSTGTTTHTVNLPQDSQYEWHFGNYFPYCGDGNLDNNEECDDGNNTSGDGCSATCTIENTPEPYCGDGNLDNNEECDDGNNTSGDGCSATCQTESTPNPYCGDGQVNSGEQCDDGNNISGDGCSATCRNEGGGGDIPLKVMGEVVSCLTEEDIVITWRTNKPATSRVLYDTVPHIDFGTPPNYGYAYSTDEDLNKVTFHSVAINGLEPGTVYYFKVISKGSPAVLGIDLSFNTGVCCAAEPGEPILEITKSVKQEFANAGDENVEYTLTVGNVGDETAVNVVVTDNLPDGLTYTEDGSTSRAWDLGGIEPGEKKIIKYLVNVDQYATARVYENVAQASADNHGTVSALVDLEVREVIVLAETGFDLHELILLLFAVMTCLGAAMVLKKSVYRA